MLLQEEYLKRHRIVLPEVHHTLASGSLIFKVDPRRSDLGSKWAVVSLTWRDNPHHPGAYEVRVQTPIYDAWNKREMWQNVRGYPPSLVLQYEEIDEFFRDFATAHGSITAIHQHTELCLTSWEIFLYTHDGLLAKQSSPKLCEAIEASIDFDLTQLERYLSYVDATNILMVEQASAFDRYELYIHTHTKSSLGWLARLVNGG